VRFRGIFEDPGEMARPFKRMLLDAGGATAIEYALIAAFLALAIITGVTGIGLKLSGYFSEVSGALK
jgi:pilus assembly protein Flp/PilA